MLNERLDRAEGPTHGAWFIVVAAALTCIGLMIVASGSASLQRPLLGPEFLKTTFGRQCVFVLAGTAIMMLTAKAVGPWLLASRDRLRAAVWIGVVVTVVSLVSVKVFGDVTRGSQRWLKFSLGGFDLGFQPSELAKPVLIGFLALFLTRDGVDARSLRKTFIPVLAVIVVGGLLIGLEDLGTAALTCLVACLMVWIGGCSYRHLITLGVVSVLGLAALIWFEPYRMDRLWAHQNLWNDSQGKGYQGVQSLLTLGSGGWWGRGLGAGVQKYGYLPESRTDFVFAVLCEELGFVGGAVVIALFASFIWLGVGAMRTARTGVETLLAFGLTALIGFQALINIAVVTVWIPTTGIPLPFISAGGSSYLVFSAMVGMLAAVGTRSAMNEAAVSVEVSEES
ncbi:MAG: stage V sporulation protein E [Planctomycetota bacterium]|nr:MAG: stage V sporulation protein E [Planctomycetota bacterium]